MNNQTESHVIINGFTLSKSQTILLCSAIKEFSLTLRNNGMDEDGNGSEQTIACLSKLSELEAMFVISQS